MDPTLLRRLAFIKYLYSVGEEQCRAPEPLAGAGLLTLHDSIELFLQVAAEHLNVTAKLGDFKDYWIHLSPKLPAGSALTQQASMQRLNRARVSLKHHGTQPSKLDLDTFKATASAFLNENCPTIFSLAFKEISLSEFVQPDGARQRVDRAIDLSSNDKFDEAAGELVIAFELMLVDYSERNADRFHRSPFRFGPTLTRFGTRAMSRLDGEVRRAIDGVVESITAMQSALRVMAIGIDFRRYARFRSIVPSVVRTLDGNFHLHEWQESKRDAEMIQFCIDFIIESAICLR